MTPEQRKAMRAQAKEPHKWGVEHLSESLDRCLKALDEVERKYRGLASSWTERNAKDCKRIAKLEAQIPQERDDFALLRKEKDKRIAELEAALNGRRERIEQLEAELASAVNYGDTHER